MFSHNPLSVCAVIVTYNRSAWLIDCLNSLLLQSQPLTSIIVINNASTDSTRIELDTFVEAHFNRLAWHIVHSRVNTGGAGGFAAGMKVAHEAGYEWTWLMDDDVVANTEGLSGLLKFCGTANILHGQRLNPNGMPFYWQSKLMPWIGFCKPYADTAFEKNDVWFTNVACFEGALIHKDVFDKIGYANPEYFISWDDTDFGYRASKYFKIAYCNTQTLTRRRGEDNINTSIRSLYRASDMYRYYHIRNRFIFSKTIQDGQANFLSKKMILVTYHLFTFVLIAKEMVRALLFKDFSLGLAPLLKGWWHGVRGYKGAMPTPK